MVRIIQTLLHSRETDQRGALRGYDLLENVYAEFVSSVVLEFGDSLLGVNGGWFLAVSSEVTPSAQCSVPSDQCSVTSVGFFISITLLV